MCSGVYSSSRTVSIIDNWENWELVFLYLWATTLFIRFWRTSGRLCWACSISHLRESWKGWRKLYYIISSKKGDKRCADKINYYWDLKNNNNYSCSSMYIVHALALPWSCWKKWQILMLSEDSQQMAPKVKYMWNMFTSLPLLVGENFSILGAHLSTLFYFG